MADLMKYVKLKRSETCGFGFSILGGAGSELPPIIYDIIEGSPAANSHQLAPGDVIWEVNGQEVIACTTKEVLNCLRLSAAEVTLKLKTDSNVQARVKDYLSRSSNPELLRSAITQDDLQGVRHIKAKKPAALQTSPEQTNSSPPPVQSPTLSVGSGHSVSSHGSRRSHGSHDSNRTISENGLSPLSDRTSSENERNKKPKKEDGVNNKANATNNSVSVRSSGSANTTSPPLSEDESDIDSLHSFHYSPKAVDMPSAVRLAKRLYGLEGFKKSDVSRHLSKNNEFSRAVAEEYLHYFEFSGDTLDEALRKFLDKFCLAGETQERERVLVHFSHRFLECNPGTFNSQDAVHTLTCAIMLLNTDLHGQSVGRKMTCNEFIDNLADLNDGENFPREVLKLLYHAISSQPLQWATDDDGESSEANNTGGSSGKSASSDGQAGGGSSPLVAAVGSNPFLAPPTGNGIQYKKGYIMRKCCTDPNGKKTAFGKRSWKMWFCVIQDLVLYLHKDEQGARKGPHPQLGINAIRLHHALATRAQDYAKKEHVFRLQTADQAEYLLQTSDSKELQAWMDTINFVAASLSAPPLPGACGSQKKFQRPLLPCSITKLNLREQLEDHTVRLAAMEKEVEEHKAHPPDKNARTHTTATYKEKEVHYVEEIKRYRTYVLLLRSRLSSAGGNSSGGGMVSGSSSNSGSGTLEVGDLPVFEAGDNSVEGGQHQQQQQQRVVPPPIPERNIGRLPADSPEPPPKSPAAVRRQQDISASSVAANGDTTTASYLLSPMVFSAPDSREPSQEHLWESTTIPTPSPPEYHDQGTGTQEEEEGGGGGLMGTLKKKKKEKEERERKDKFQKEMERKEKEIEKKEKETEKKRKEEEKKKMEEEKKIQEKEKKEKEKERKEQERERKEQEKQEKKEREKQVKEEKKNKEKEEKDKRKSLAAVMEWEKQRDKATKNDAEEEFNEDPKVGTLNRLSALFKFSKLNNQNTDGDIDNEPEQQKSPLITREMSFREEKPPPLPPKPSPNSAIMKNTGTRIDV